jgi:hypothetical protein
MSLARKLWQRARNLFPVEGFHLDRPVVLFQSDDWGRAGLRDQEGLEQLRYAGLKLGERPYDLYTLETAEDLAAVRSVLSRHRDSSGRLACLGMNFVVANLDFEKMKGESFRQIHLLPVADGFPSGWHRPGLLEAYREGIAEKTFHPALHGSTHFCRPAVERFLDDDGERGSLLRTLWHASTPYIHWRMPWIGYEYWDPEKSEDERFLSASTQRELIGQTVGAFARLFATLPRSACAPGYRTDHDTHRAWAQYGIRVAQNGPGTLTPPHFDSRGMLHLYRTVEFEPATDPAFSLEECTRRAENCFARGIPATISLHSINFHSSVGNFRDRSLRVLDQFLSALETTHPDLLYLHDEDLYELVSKGSYETSLGTILVNVTKKPFTKAQVAREAEAETET